MPMHMLYACMRLSLDMHASSCTLEQPHSRHRILEQPHSRHRTSEAHLEAHPLGISFNLLDGGLVLTKKLSQDPVRLRPLGAGPLMRLARVPKMMGAISQSVSHSVSEGQSVSPSLTPSLRRT
mmetsp:Transcript_77016/g.152825  ORF Transcript_77016/g.152825 Transcript_77016/m.152825 type:complete len:123 (-) Transcript_77016:78-446(-)